MENKDPKTNNYYQVEFPFFLESKSARKKIVYSLSILVEYAKKSGSNNADRYYSIYTKMIYKQIFQSSEVEKKYLNQLELRKLIKADIIVSESIIDAVKRNVYYKNCYVFSKKQLKRYITHI